jgi:peptidoglycan/LPS O-acetylase OafA/YrhL
MKKLGRRPELDGLRGIAIILVVGVHGPSRYVHFARGGVLGVDLFFVLSGFLITSLLLAERHEQGTVSLRRFYIRRGRRLLPALALVVAVFALASAISGVTWHIAERALLRVSYASNFLIAVTDGGVGYGFEHLWSLAQEEQFYLLWPIALLLILRRGGRARHLLLALAAAIAAVNAVRVGAVIDGAGWRRLWFAPDTHGDAILFGCCVMTLASYRYVERPFLQGRRVKGRPTRRVPAESPARAG